MRLSATVLRFVPLVCLQAAIQLCVWPANAADPAPPKVFGGAQIQEVYRIRLDRDDLVLESINAAIKEHNIQDGLVLTGVGSVQACTYHGVQSLAASARDHVTRAKGPMEIDR